MDKGYSFSIQYSCRNKKLECFGKVDKKGDVTSRRKGSEKKHIFKGRFSANYFAS